MIVDEKIQKGSMQSNSIKQKKKEESIVYEKNEKFFRQYTREAGIQDANCKKTSDYLHNMQTSRIA